MKTLILLALVPVVFCNTSDESRRQSAEMKALDAKLERMLDEGKFLKVHSDVTLFLNKEDLAHDAAEAKCQSHNGHLASPTSLRQLNLLDNNSDTWRYTSGTKDVSANVWSWGTGEHIRPSARGFYKGQPHSYACLLYPYPGPNNENVFLSVPCGTGYKITCELDGLKLGNSEFDAIHIKKTYVIVAKTNINYAQAEAECAAMGSGAHLATPTNKKEMNLILSNLITGATDEYWLGAKRAGIHERGVWLTGEPIIDNILPMRKDVGGNCLSTYSKYFDWLKCSGPRSTKSNTEGYVCQIDI